MPEVISPLSQSVREAMKHLESLLENYRDCGTQGEKSSWPNCYATTWDQLTRVLERAHSIHHPAPHEGLAAVWLRVVARMAHRVEQEANASQNGFQAIADHGCQSFSWLLNVAEYLGRKTLLADDQVTKRLAKAATPDVTKTPLDELKLLAEESELLFKSAPLSQRRSTGQTKQANDLDIQTQGLIKKSGRAILSYINDGITIINPILDEVVLFSIGLDYKSIRFEYVTGALANLWITDRWQSFTNNYWTHAGELKDDLPVTLCQSKISTALWSIVSKLESLNGHNDSSYYLDLKRNSVICEGNSYPISNDGMLMLGKLLETDDWCSMSALSISKPRRVFKGLPECIQKRIESASSKGYRIRPEYRR